MKRETIIQALAEAINTSRDFCGDAAEAVRDTFSDFGIPYDDSLVIEAYMVADNEWRECQKAAGVPREYWKN